MPMSRKAISKKIREAVKARFGGLCGYCGKHPNRLEVDHIEPVRNCPYRRPGLDPNEEENLMPACPACNNFKTTMTLEEFREQLGMQVERGRKNSVNFRLAERFQQIQATESPIVFHFERIANEQRQPATKESL